LTLIFSWITVQARRLNYPLGTNQLPPQIPFCSFDFCPLQVPPTPKRPYATFPGPPPHNPFFFSLLKRDSPPFPTAFFFLGMCFPLGCREFPPPPPICRASSGLFLVVNLFKVFFLESPLEIFFFFFNPFFFFRLVLVGPPDSA